MNERQRLVTSATLERSMALRLRHLATRIHELGPRPLFELMCELVGGADPLGRFEAYGKLDPEFIHKLGADKLPPTVFLVRKNPRAVPPRITFENRHCLIDVTPERGEP